jgi:hypothetical protein
MKILGLTGKERLMSDMLDFERFEKEVKTFAQIKKKYERLLNEFYSEQIYKGSYVDKSTIEKVVDLAKRDEDYRTRAFDQSPYYRVFSLPAGPDRQPASIPQSPVKTDGKRGPQGRPGRPQKASDRHTACPGDSVPKS